MITIKVRALTSLAEKGIGLIFAKEAYPVLLRTRFGIHTFGMRFPIDVVLLDNNNIVVKVWKSIYPNRVIVYPLWYTTVLELPQGTIQSRKIDIGRKIKIIFNNR